MTWRQHPHGDSRFLTYDSSTLTLAHMKTVTRELRRLTPVAVGPSKTGMYTDPEAPAIQEAQRELIDRLADAAPGSVVPLLLTNVELSASCIAKLLGAALTAIVQKHVQEKFVVVEDPTGRSAWDGDAGLRKESERRRVKLVCVWSGRGGTLELVGAADEQVRNTYNFVLRHWSRHRDVSTARDLAEAEGVSIQAASNRLSKAASLGLLYAADKEPVAGGGSQYVFVPVV